MRGRRRCRRGDTRREKIRVPLVAHEDFRRRDAPSRLCGARHGAMCAHCALRGHVDCSCRSGFSRELFVGLVAVFSKERSEEHTSELQSLMRISYAVFCLKKKKQDTTHI